MNIIEEIKNKIDSEIKEINLVSPDNKIENAFGIIHDNCLYIQIDKLNEYSLGIIRNINNLAFDIKIHVPGNNFFTFLEFLNDMELYDISDDTVYKLIYDSFGKDFIISLMKDIDHKKYDRNFFKKYYTTENREKVLKDLGII